MKSYLFLYILLSSSPSLLFGQRTGIDSMIQKLSSAQEDSDKVNLLNKISFALSDYDTKSGLQYGNQSMLLAEKIHWRKGVASASNSIGVNHLQNSHGQKALDYFQKALVINQELNDKKQVAQNIGNISLIYQLLGDYPKALQNLFAAIKQFESLNDTMGIAKQYGNIGNIYQEMGNPRKAIYYDSLSLLKHKELGSKSGIANLLGNIGNAFSDLKEYTKSLEYTLQSLALYREIKQHEGIARNLNNLGVLYESMGNLSKALDYHFGALRINKERKNAEGTMLSLGNIGNIYLTFATPESRIPTERFLAVSKKESLSLALNYLSESVKMGEEIHTVNHRVFFLERYAEALEYAGNYKNALANYRRYHKLRDSAYNLESSLKIENLTTERELELKDKQIQLDKLEVARKKEGEVFLLAGIFFLLTIIIPIYRSFKKQKTLNNELAFEKQKSDTLLLNILPAEIAEELKSTGTSKARQYDTVSVLFTDFVNFTGVSETMSPQELVAEINYCFKTFDEIIERNGLEKIKTIGDAYLAVCGLPNELSDHAERATRVALEIQDFIKQSNGKFKIRIGIHSGPVIAGIVGIHKYAYDIWGDTVNTANRMESSAEAGKINISGSTQALIHTTFHCVYRGKISAKNKGKMDMYYVEGIL